MPIIAIPTAIPDVLTIEPKVFEMYRDWETDRKSTRLNSSHRL